MIITYDIYKRDPKSGIRTDLIQEFESLSLTLNWSKRSKFSITGKAMRYCPLALGDYVVIFRNSELIFEGLVQEVSIACNDISAETIDWTVSGDDDSVIFDWRIILTDYGANKDFSDLTFDADTYDKCEDTVFGRLVHYINSCYGGQTMTSRKSSGLGLPDQNDVPVDKRGTTELSAYRLKKLSEVLREIGKEAELFPKYKWNAVTGSKSVEIPIQADKTNSVVVAPQFGNVTKWSVKRTFPKFNAIWVCSGEYTEVENKDTENEQEYVKRVWVYAEDLESIKQYGRIESTLTKSDIKITDDNEETEEDETLTEQDVIKLLTEEARKALEENRAKEKYSVTLAENEDLLFMRDWQCGDKVKVIIDKDENGKQKIMYSTIESVGISYSGLEEKLKPTIGEIESGLFGELFETISGIDRRLRNEEEK